MESRAAEEVFACSRSRLGVDDDGGEDMLSVVISVKGGGLSILGIRYLV
jgi:hypothetical protein